MTQPVGIIRKTMRWSPEGAEPGPWTWLQPGPNRAACAAPVHRVAAQRAGHDVNVGLVDGAGGFHPLGTALLQAVRVSPAECAHIDAVRLASYQLAIARGHIRR